MNETAVHHFMHPGCTARMRTSMSAFTSARPLASQPRPVAKDVYPRLCKESTKAAVTSFAWRIDVHQTFIKGAPYPLHSHLSPENRLFARSCPMVSWKQILACHFSGVCLSLTGNPARSSHIQSGGLRTEYFASTQT